MKTSEGIARISIGSEIGEFLSSRHSAAELRHRLLAVAETDAIVLDFESVECVSHSFADELFGVLVESLGFDWFAKNVTLCGLSTDVRASILDSIQLRVGGVSFDGVEA